MRISCSRDVCECCAISIKVRGLLFKLMAAARIDEIVKKELNVETIIYPWIAWRIEELKHRFLHLCHCDLYKAFINMFHGRETTIKNQMDRCMVIGIVLRNLSIFFNFQMILFYFLNYKFLWEPELLNSRM